MHDDIWYNFWFCQLDCHLLRARVGDWGADRKKTLDSPVSGIEKIEICTQLEILKSLTNIPFDQL